MRFYDLETLKKEIKKSLDLIGGLSNFVKRNDKILIKPNMLRPSNIENAVTTHPEFCRAVIQLLRKNNIKNVSIGDSPSIGNCNHVAKIIGIRKVCDEENVELISFKPKKYLLKNGKVVKKIELPNIYDYFDVIINLPKLKTNILTQYSGAVKNLFGLVCSNKQKYHLKYRNIELFNDFLLDIYEFVKPSLNIMDGIIGMEGRGPDFGNPIKLNMIISSNDALALDVITCKKIGIRNFLMQRNAEKRNIVSSKEKNIIIKDKVAKHFKIKCAVPFPSIIYSSKYIYNIFIQFPAKIHFQPRFILKRPVITERCIKCYTCKKVCPVNAISSDLKINYKKCIRCYCCHEVCPNNAISLIRSWT